jgi:basic membrane lipoprotein Med (substrate-binding protein (PBP1-ABC) superfamily)
MMAQWLVATVIILLISVVGAVGGTPEPLKVGFIYVGSVSDYGCSYAHDQGRKYLEATVPDVKTTHVESVPEGADAERVLTQLARSGHKVIVATSYGYMDTVLKVAERFPDVVFLHCGCLELGAVLRGGGQARARRDLAEHRRLVAHRDGHSGPVSPWSGGLRGG